MKRFLLKITLSLALVILLTVALASCGESKDLTFMLLEDDTYAVIGIGDCHDKALVIPKTHEGKPVTQIDSHAFNGCDTITSVIIPEGVISIGACAFANCDELVEVTIPASVTVIGEHAFAGNDNFTKVNIFDLAAWCKIQFNNVFANPLHYAHRLYVDGKAISELIIPEGVSTVGDYAFTGLNHVISLTLPDTLIKIGDGAFFHCTRLRNVMMSEGVTHVGLGAFSMCEKLQYTEYGNGKYLGTEQNAYRILVQPTDWNFTDYTIHENTEIIAEHALAGCKKLTSIKVPDSVTVIGSEAFDSCTGLESVVLGSGVQSIEDKAFYFCEKLTSINLPASLESIGFNAFSYCMTLPSITIPKSVTTIEEGAFFACGKLTIHCEAKAAPSGWHERWKQTDLTVTWGE